MVKVSRICRACGERVPYVHKPGEDLWSGVCIDCESKKEEAILLGEERGDPLLNKCPNCGDSLTEQSWNGLISPKILQTTGATQKVSVTCGCKAELIGERGPADALADRRVWIWVVAAMPPKGALTRKKGEWDFN